MSTIEFDKVTGVALTALGGFILFLWSIGEILASASTDVTLLGFAVAVAAIFSGVLAFIYPRMHARFGLIALLSGVFLMIYIGLYNINSMLTTLLTEILPATNTFHAVFPFGLFLTSVGGIFLITYRTGNVELDSQITDEPDKLASKTSSKSSDAAPGSSEPDNMSAEDDEDDWSDKDSDSDSEEENEPTDH